jgi:biopolymer transport protein ExbB
MGSTADESFSLLQYFQLGGVFMWPLLVFSIFTVTIVIERAICLFYNRLRVDDIEEKAAAAIAEGEDAEAVLTPLCRRCPGARVLLAIVRRRSLSETRMEKAAETEALSQIGLLENRLGFLPALGSIAPLTGFLGTVSGMIGAFRSIAQATEVNAQLVANGIYEALITTVFGLVIAIIALTAHSLLSLRVDRFASDVESSASHLIAGILESRQGDR